MPTVSRRNVLRAFPILFGGAALGGLGRVLAACDEASVGEFKPRNKNVVPTTAPTDDDEFVPENPEATPVDASEPAAASLPNLAWEARVRQLEDEQRRLFGATFTAAAPGVFAGKERSHVPQLTPAKEAGKQTVIVQVLHVMGKNGLDGGITSVDASPDTGSTADAGTDARGPDGGRDAATDATPTTQLDAAAPPVHYITTIFLRGVVQGQLVVVGLWEFASTDPAPASVKFTMPEGVTSVVAYEWCTLHGLWAAEPLVL